MKSRLKALDAWHVKGSLGMPGVEWFLRTSPVSQLHRPMSSAFFS